MIPKIDGFGVLKKIRERKDMSHPRSHAKDSVEDTVRGLDAGCDDYLTKPLPLLNCSQEFAPCSAVTRKKKSQCCGLQTCLSPSSRTK